jgi:hypothetical protein
MRPIPSSDVVCDHQWRLDEAMADVSAVQAPFNVAGARYSQAAPLFLDDVKEGGSRRPNDLHAMIVQLSVDMEMTASDHRNVVPNEGFEQA